MRDYRGVSYDRIEDLKSREAISTIDEFLRQLSFSVANLSAGKRADASGTIITAPPVLDDYFYLPGRPGGQIGHGGDASGNSLTLVSNRSSDGKIYLGTASTSAYDEANERFGIGTSSPGAFGHFHGTPASSVIQGNSDVTLLAPAVGGQWYVAGVPSGFATAWESVQTDDGIVSYMFRPTDIVGTWTHEFLLDGVITDGVEYTITYTVCRNGTLPDPCTLGFSMVNSAGVRAAAAGFNAIGVSTYPTFDTRTVTISDFSGATGQTPNSFRITLGFGSNPGPSVIVSYISISGGTTTGARAILLAERPADSTLPYLECMDESNVVVASVNSEGAGQFQNVLLEDPGAGIGTVTLKAPTGVTSYTLTLPADDGAADEIIQSNGSGVLDFVPISGDATLAAGGALTLATLSPTIPPGAYGSATQVPAFTVNAKGLVTTAANVAITYPDYSGTYQPLDADLTAYAGFANPTTNIGLTTVNGTATTAMRSDGAPALNQEIAPTWTGNHIFLRSSGEELPIKISTWGLPGGNVVEQYDSAGNQVSTLDELGSWWCRNALRVGVNAVSITAPATTDTRNARLPDVNGTFLLIGYGADPPLDTTIAIVNRTGSNTVTAAASNLLTSANHGLVYGNTVRFTTSASDPPLGIVVGTIYYVKTVPTNSTFTISTTLGGTELDIIDAGTGTHTVVFGNLGSVNLTNNTAAGFYMITAYISCSEAGDGAPMFSVTYADGMATQTNQPVAFLSVMGVGDYSSGTFMAYLASGNITWAVTGYATTGIYKVKARTMYLGA